MGQGGLTPIVLDTLAQTSALTALDLLQVLRTLFEFHPRPKQYVAQHGILEHLQRLAAGGDRSRRQSVLVQKQAGSLPAGAQGAVRHLTLEQCPGAAGLSSLCSAGAFGM